MRHSSWGHPCSSARPRRNWQWDEASNETSCEVLVLAPGFGALRDAAPRPAVRSSLLRSFLQQRRTAGHFQSVERQAVRFGQTLDGGPILRRQRMEAGERRAGVDDDGPGIAAL